MGIIKEVKRKELSGPECPVMFLSVYEKYREMKFVQRDTGNLLRLYSRDMLTWQDIAAYKSVTGQEISMLESELIMGLDGIYEGKDDG